MQAHMPDQVSLFFTKVTTVRVSVLIHLHGDIPNHTKKPGVAPLVHMCSQGKESRKGCSKKDWECGAQDQDSVR